MLSRLISLVLFILLLGMPLILNAQEQNPEKPGFVHLDGKVEEDGTTHLFYQIYEDTPPVINEEDTHETFNNHVYHYNTDTKEDSIFLKSDKHVEGEYIPGGGTHYVTIKRELKDFEFIGSGIEEYVSTVTTVYHEVSGVIYHNKVGRVFNTLFSLWYNKEEGGIITKSPTSDILYVNSDKKQNITILGDSSGTRWPDMEFISDSARYNFRVFEALSSKEQNNRDILIGQLKDALIVKKGRIGQTDTVNTSRKWSDLSKILVDADSTHLYFKLEDNRNPSSGKLIISDQRAEQGSFTESGYEVSDRLKLAVDDSTSGRLFAIDGKRVLRSTDYGKSFRFWHEMNVAPTGIYFDSYHQDLYISTSKYIFRVDPSKPFHERDTVRETEIISTANKERPVARRPEEFELKPNYPNPFNPSTNIEYRLPEAAQVELTVYNAAGKKLFTKVDQYQSAGSHKVRLDMSGYSSGFYFYRLKTNDRQQTRKMLFLK